MPRNRTPAKKRANTDTLKRTAADRRADRARSASAALPDDGLQPQQRTFCLLYLANGFNATAAYKESHPGVGEDAARANGSRSLRIANIRAFLNTRLEGAWKPLQMGGEQALARVALLAEDSVDERVKLAALRTILEQSGKLKSIPDSIDALAAAIRADQEKHKGV